MTFYPAPVECKSARKQSEIFSGAVNSGIFLYNSATRFISSVSSREFKVSRHFPLLTECVANKRFSGFIHLLLTANPTSRSHLHGLVSFNSPHPFDKKSCIWPLALDNRFRYAVSEIPNMKDPSCSTSVLIFSLSTIRSPLHDRIFEALYIYRPIDSDCVTNKYHSFQDARVWLSLEKIIFFPEQ